MQWTSWSLESALAQMQYISCMSSDNWWTETTQLIRIVKKGEKRNQVNWVINGFVQCRYYQCGQVAGKWREANLKAVVLKPESGKEGLHAAFLSEPVHEQHQTNMQNCRKIKDYKWALRIPKHSKKSEPCSLFTSSKTARSVMSMIRS